MNSSLRETVKIISHVEFVRSTCPVRQNDRLQKDTEVGAVGRFSPVCRERELGLNNYSLLEKERERRPLPHLKHRTLIYTELDAIPTKDINREATQGNLKKRKGI
ncbi:hypothetical protein AOLI_G00173080 [Acnodon oligacanthus]